MKKSIYRAYRICLVLGAMMSVWAVPVSGAAEARTISPIVSVEWLQANSGMRDLVVLDVRSGDAYAEGHIPGSISAPFEVPFSAWITMRDDLLLEIPETADLFAAIGALGIETDTKVVVVSAPNPGEPPHYGLSGATRVADTLIYAGVVDVSVLDGGHPKWVADGLPVTTDVPTVTPVVFDGAVDEEMFVTSDYVRANLFRAEIIDARDAEVYYGALIEPFADKAGHIYGASSLPAPWIWDTNDNVVFTYKDADLLDRMAHGVIRHHGCREIIVYCGVGGYASSWWFVLTQVLGYRNVKFYDGSAQEWVREHHMRPFKWQ